MKSKTKNYFTALYILLSILFIFLETQGDLGFLHKMVQWSSVPVRSSLYQFRASTLSPLSSFATINDEIKKLRDLEVKNALLQSEIANNQSVKEENIQMRRLLDTGLPSAWKFSPARVVLVNVDTVFLLNEPKQNPGVPVIVSLDVQEGGLSKKSGVLVGRIKEVVGGESKVDLSTNTSSKIPVIVRDINTMDRRASGILEGRGGKAILVQVLATEDLKEGDLILTSGDAGLPPDLLVGYVGKVLSVQNSLLKQAETKPIIQPEGLEYVFLITKF